MKAIDLRSDTVTQPAAAMREAMARAEVGDDVYGEDPTVNQLEARCAELLGKEAAVFVPSGTMANQVALRSLTRHGDVVMLSHGAHVLLYESGGPAALAGLQLKAIGSDGLFDADDVRAGMHPQEQHFAPTTTVCVENTHNQSGGRVFPFEQLKGVAEAARDLGLSLHLDGARLFNAVVETGVPADRWGELFDTVSFCFSKGLGTPVGSVVCTSSDLVRHARRARKMLGGGMRQVGILAAAGLYALDYHIERLGEDHTNAKRLAAGLRERGIALRRDPETNMVLFEVDDVLGFIRATRSRELLINPIDERTFRAVTHLDVNADDIDDALGRIDESLKELRG